MSAMYKGKKFKVKNVKGSGMHLNLRGKKIEDITEISGLDELSDLVLLNLYENKITEISGLSNLKNLISLSISDNNITEIKGLENLINLKNLNLERNQISEIKGLENLENLNHLSLSNNNITELKGLENLSNLNNFYLFSNPIFDWIREDIGSFRLAQTAVKYCARKVGKDQFNLEEIEQFLTIKNEEITTAVQAKKYHDVTEILRKVYNEVKLDDPTLYYKFFGEFLWKFPKLFENKKFIIEYMAEINYIVTDKQGFQMETYIINNYCTYEGEEVLTSFFGKIEAYNMDYEGRIHLTNFRIFLFGRKDDVNKPIFVPFGGLIVQIVRDVMKSEGKRMMSKYGRGEDLPGFGYQFPLINVDKKDIDDIHLKIRCKVGSSNFKMKISPKQFKNENEKELSERIKHLASIIPEES